MEHGIEFFFLFRKRFLGLKLMPSYSASPRGNLRGCTASASSAFSRGCRTAARIPACTAPVSSALPVSALFLWHSVLCLFKRTDLLTDDLGVFILLHVGMSADKYLLILIQQRMIALILAREYDHLHRTEQILEQ